MSKKCLINVSEEPNMINATLDNGRSLKHVFLGVSCSFCFKLLEKIKNILNSINTKSNQYNIFYKLRVLQIKNIKLQKRKNNPILQNLLIKQ